MLSLFYSGFSIQWSTKILSTQRFLPFQSLRLSSLLLVLSVLLMTQACSPGQALSILTGGGPNVAANTQIGKENTQTIGTSTQQKFAPQSVTVSLPESQTSTLRPQPRPQIEQVQNQTNNELPNWIWIAFLLLFVVGLLTDTPSSYFERRRLLKRIKDLENRV